MWQCHQPWVLWPPFQNQCKSGIVQEMGILRGHKKMGEKQTLEISCSSRMCIHTHSVHLFIYPAIYLSIHLSPFNYPSVSLYTYIPGVFQNTHFYPLSTSFYCILSAPIKLREEFRTFSRDAAFPAFSHLQMLLTHAASIPISFGIAKVRNPCGILPSPGRIPPSSCSMRAA